MWVTVSDERTGLSFTIVPGPRQHSHSQVRVPRDSCPYFILRFETSLFVSCYDSQGYGGGIRPHLHTEHPLTHSQLTLSLAYNTSARTT
jgi:hypothetical protein